MASSSIVFDVHFGGGGGSSGDAFDPASSASVRPPPPTAAAVALRLPASALASLAAAAASGSPCSLSIESLVAGAAAPSSRQAVRKEGKTNSILALHFGLPIDERKKKLNPSSLLSPFPTNNRPSPPASPPGPSPPATTGGPATWSTFLLPQPAIPRQPPPSSSPR